MKLTDPSLPVNQAIADPSVARLYIDDDAVDNVWMLDHLASYIQAGSGTKILTITFMGLAIDEIPGTNISAVVLYPNLYNNAGVEGDITVGGALPSAGLTGDVIFTPTNSSAIYDIEIFGRFAAAVSHGDVQVGWAINTGGFMYSSAGYCRDSYPNAAQSGVVRHLGSAGATGPLQSAGEVDGIAQTLTIRIIQRP